MRTPYIAALAAAAASACLAPAAWAAQTFEARIDNVQISFKDLRPDDGIAPITQLINTQTLLSAHTDVLDPKVTSPNAFASLTLPFDTPTFKANVTSGQNFLHLTATNTQDSAASAYFEAAGQVKAGNDDYWSQNHLSGIVLAPFTAVHFTGTLYTRYEDDGQPKGWNGQGGYATASIEANGAKPGQLSLIGDVRVNSYASGDVNMERDFDENNTHFDFWLANNTTVEQKAYFIANVSGRVSGVPEADAWALSLAGVLTCLALRRARKPAHTQTT